MLYFNKAVVPMLLAAALMAVTQSARAGEDLTTRTRTIVVDPRSVDGAAVRAWIEQNSPRFPPRLQAERLEVSRTMVFGPGETHRSPGDSPPVPLPASGKPGEVISFSSERSGGMESWTYRWRAGANGGGSWTLIGYTFKYFDEQAR